MKSRVMRMVAAVMASFGNAVSTAQKMKLAEKPANSIVPRPNYRVVGSQSRFKGIGACNRTKKHNMLHVSKKAKRRNR